METSDSSLAICSFCAHTQVVREPSWLGVRETSSPLLTAADA